MSRIIYRAFVEDAKDKKFSDQEINALIGIFELVIKEHFSETMGKADYDLHVFPEAVAAGIGDFSMSIDKYPGADANQWKIVFEQYSRKLKAFVTLAPI